MGLNVPVFIVLPTDHIGGAEKRFAGLWQYLLTHSDLDVRLVVGQSLLDHLSTVPELSAMRERRDRITIVEPYTKEQFKRTLRELEKQSPRAIIHVVTGAPWKFHRYFSRRSIFTVTTARMALLNWRGLVGSYLGAALSARTDVLDPAVHHELQDRVFFRRDSILHTPSSFVDTDAYGPSPFAERKNKLVFVGLFRPEKGPHRLLDAIPELWAALQARGVKDAEFIFLGRDSGSDKLSLRCASMQQTVPVRAYFEPNPSAVLSKAKVFFSLQRLENYPSKSLLEALGCGTVPIATDVGNTRQIVDSSFGYLIPREFTAADLIEPCHEILTADEPSYQARVTLMRQWLHDRFSIEQTAQYFERLYQSIGN
jgi:glycosyltransferase involved in cell wall biosynthesis